MISSAASGIRLYDQIINNRREEPLRKSFTKHVLLGMIICGFVALASAIESYIFVLMRGIISHFC